MSASIALKRLLLVALVFPGLASAQVLRYASPTGSASNPGSRQSPWNIIRSLGACSNDTTIILLDGIYLQDSTATWTIGSGGGRSRMISDPGARPVFTRRNNQSPRIYTRGNTTLDGIWFGGRGINDSIGTALGHDASRVPTCGDSIVGCVFFNTWDNGIGTGSAMVVIKNCLFVNNGMRSDQHYHGVYLSGQANSPESSLVTYRNVFVTTDPEKPALARSRWASKGWSLHYWHNPKYARIQKNFTTYGAVHHGEDVLARDNVFWQGGVMFTTMEGIVHDSVAIDTPHVWRKNAIVKDVDPTEAEYFTWPDPIAERGNPAFPEVMWWDGDSTWLSNQWRELGQGYVRKLGTVHRPAIFNFPADVPALFGSSAASIDSAIARLGRSFYDKSAEEVHADTTIFLNWQKLVDVVDYWQGALEERVDKGTTSVVIDEPNIPSSWSLDQNYPNPFNPTTTIRFGLPHRSDVTLKIYDALGRQVATLLDATETAGTHEVDFSAEAIASGVYFYRLRAGDFESTRKLIVVK
jgi:hypothetical protein